MFKDNYRIYGLIIVKTEKNLLVLDYGLSNATFETPNHAFAHYWSIMVKIQLFKLFLVIISKDYVGLKLNDFLNV
jgi:hypothetical protein